MLQFRMAIHDDIPALSNLLAQLFAQEKEFTPDPAAQDKALKILIDRPDRAGIFVAELEGIVVGMVNMLYLTSTALGDTVAILEDMVVSESVRGESIGTQLIQYAMSEARRNGVQRITLLTDEDNLQAHQFYQRHGFKKSSMQVWRQML